MKTARLSAECRVLSAEAIVAVRYSGLRTWNSGQRCSEGSALVETAILLPVYALLLVGLLYFGSVSLLRQELPLLARYAAESASDVPTTFLPEALIPITAGVSLADGAFTYWNGAAAPAYTEEPPLTASQAGEEMTKVSWSAHESVVLDPATGGVSQSTSVKKTKAWAIVYACGALERAPEIADQMSRWYSWRTVEIETVHDAPLYRTEWGYDERSSLAGLEPPLLKASAASAVRSDAQSGAGVFTRDLSHQYRGTHPAVEDVVVGYWGGAWPVSGYPDYGGSQPFWVPD